MWDKDSLEYALMDNRSVGRSVDEPKLWKLAHDQQELLMHQLQKLFPFEQIPFAGTL